VGTIGGGGVGTTTGGDVGITKGVDEEGDGMGTRAGEGDCMGALCGSIVGGGMDVDVLVARILKTYCAFFGTLFSLCLALSFPLSRLDWPSDVIVNWVKLKLWQYDKEVELLYMYQ